MAGLTQGSVSKSNKTATKQGGVGKCEKQRVRGKGLSKAPTGTKLNEENIVPERQ
jgi:hypothetical protein